jgi:hypothetical protein
MLTRVMLRRWRDAHARFFMRTRTGRTLVFLSLPAVLLVIAFWEPDRAPPIFDAQVHYNEEAWPVYSSRAILGGARKHNIPWLVVSSTPNDGTFRLTEPGAVRVIPLFAPYRSAADRDNWFESTEILAMMEAAVASGRYRGIGEFHLYDGQVDTPVVRRMVALAAERDLVLSAHSDPNAIRQLYALEPRLRILWAHAGMTTSPATVGELLDRYPRLHAELSHRTDVAPRGALAPEWRELFLRHPNRFLLGSGTYNNEYWYQFRYVHARYREWLRELPPELAERIAWHNGLAFFGEP